MNGLSIALAALGLCALLAAAYGYRRTQRTIRRLEAMLEQAISGRFDAHVYDEDTVSRLEFKMSRLLQHDALTRARLEKERGYVETLIGDISHQTKTPLANILLYAQLLGEQPLPKSAVPLAEFIGMQAEKLQFLIGALCKASRLEAGCVQVRPCKSSVSELFGALAAQYGAKAAVKGVCLTFEETALFAQFDPRWTMEAVGNLIDNAVKYTPEGGHIRVSASATPMFCRLAVADDGPGIPQEEHAKVFERFFRGQGAAAQEGVGLGLYLAREIALSQGGYMRLRSEPGKGAELCVFLPACGERM